MKKKLALILLITFISVNLYAQERSKMRPKDRLIIGLFSDIWSDLPANMDTRALNRGISIDYVQEFPLGTSNFSIAAGLGFASHNLYSDHFYSRNPLSGNHEFMPIPQNFDYDNNKISLNYLNVPVEFRYRTRNTPRTFRIHAGIKTGLLVNAHTKYVGDFNFFDTMDTRETKIKEGKLDNVETLMVGFHGRIGYGRLNLNTFVSFTDIFEGNNAANANFISLGLSFIVF